MKNDEEWHWLISSSRQQLSKNLQMCLVRKADDKHDHAKIALIFNDTINTNEVSAVIPRIRRMQGMLVKLQGSHVDSSLAFKLRLKSQHDDGISYREIANGLSLSCIYHLSSYVSALDEGDAEDAKRARDAIAYILSAANKSKDYIEAWISINSGEVRERLAPQLPLEGEDIRETIRLLNRKVNEEKLVFKPPEITIEIRELVRNVLQLFVALEQDIGIDPDDPNAAELFFKKLNPYI